MRMLAFLIALVTASAAVASVTHARHTDRSGRDIELIASVKRGFGVNGVPVTGLYPGARRPLRVTITNTYAFPIKVAAPTAKIAATTNRAGCTGTAANLGITSAGLRRLSLRAHKQKTVILQVAMPSTVANACQGATFTISFRAKATRA
jgi:predicted metal-dependent phosphotriesterase family hydrolase